jgi:hypothetical protein
VPRTNQLPVIPAEPPNPANCGPESVK